MYETSDIRKGLKVTMDGKPFIVVDFQHVKPGKGRAFTRTKLKNLISGAVLERTFFTGDKLESAELEEHTMQYLYPEGDKFVFMNTENYEQVTLDGEQVGDAKDFLLDNLEVQVLFYEGRPISITLPTFVEMQITHCEPGIRGDTASGTTKPATLSTGRAIQVPLFVEDGEWVRIDTRNGDYVERVKR
ncbi:MAG: elongation factor P [Deltaproteobacteria bacterium]|nr:elongation factor P [Deltaproteobacteria bacterium]